MLNLISVYAPQTGRSMVEKEEFLAMLGEVLSGIDSGERLLICGDLNGHVGYEIDGFESGHGGCGFGKRNVEGEMILETADALNLAVLNTWFKNERRLFTYENDEGRTVVDYILSRKSERKMIRDVKVVKVECIKQHRLLICVFDLKERVGLKCKVKPVKRCKVWKLKQAETKAIFSERVQARAVLMRQEPGDVEMVWKDLKDCFREKAVDVCGEHGVSLDKKRLGGGTRRLQPWLRRSSVYSNYGMGLRSARRGADVGQQEGESCAGVGVSLETRGVARTWNQGDRTTTRQRVMLRELFSRQKL